MEKIPADNKISIEKTYKKLKEDEITGQELVREERKKKREETYEKFIYINERLKENILIQQAIKDVINELKFNIKDTTRPNYAYYLLFIFTTIAMVTFSILCKFNIIYFNIKNFFIPIVMTFILINVIAFYVTRHIKKRKTYSKYINLCKKNNVNNESVFELINTLLDNSALIADVLPKSFFNYFIKEYSKNKFDLYINFLCKNNKTLLKKYKNKRLRLYKGRYNRNTEILLDIEEMQNNYFHSKISGPIVDTIDECLKKFLNNQ